MNQTEKFKKKYSKSIESMHKDFITEVLKVMSHEVYKINKGATISGKSFQLIASKSKEVQEASIRLNNKISIHNIAYIMTLFDELEWIDCGCGVVGKFKKR